MNLDQRRARALVALDGLSVGDAFGQYVLRGPGAPARVVAARTVPRGPWRYSDDTAMGLAVTRVLLAHGHIAQDALAQAFAADYRADTDRGYGAVAHWILTQIAAGRAWREVAREPYGGTGSMGNGAAMRVAPVGAWFADEPGSVAREAVASAVVTHAHPEGQAGAVAVALAAAHACETHRTGRAVAPDAALARIADFTPEGETRRRLREAARLVRETPARAAAALGDGTEVTAPDTVPFALWCACTAAGDYADALWRAMAGLLAPGADRDTVCAIVGGVVALSAGRASIPPAWLAAREPLPAVDP